MPTYLLQSTNKYRGTCVHAHAVATGDNALARGMAWFDARHTHEGEFCDYCKAKWEHHYGGMIRRVDHDGATVHYEVYPIKEIPL